MAVEKFTINVSEALLADLRRRLDATRWPDELENVGWELGSSLSYMKSLTDYWRNAYEWRRQEATLNQLPQYRVALDGFHVHFVHVRSKHPKPLPLSITHGWPRSFVEMVKLIPLLTDPVAYGGSAEDAFDVIVPSLPGYGFSDRPTERGMNPFKDTGSGFKDDKLKSEDFFYAEHDPYITFKSSKIVQTGPTTFDVPGTFTSGCAIFTFSAWGSR